jgi:hypothetical protein
MNFMKAHQCAQSLQLNHKAKGMITGLSFSLYLERTLASEWRIPPACPHSLRVILCSSRSVIGWTGVRV